MSNVSYGFPKYFTRISLTNLFNCHKNKMELIKSQLGRELHIFKQKKEIQLLNRNGS